MENATTQAKPEMESAGGQANSNMALARLRQNAIFNMNMAEILALCYTKWYWFVISLVLCMSAALIYISRTTPMFKTEASIMLVSESNSSNQPGVDLSMLGLHAKKVNITDESYLLESPFLFEEVVQKLGLNNRYSTKSGLRMVELYKDEPIIVTPAENIPVESYSFKIDLDGNKNFVLSDFSGCDPSIKVKGSLGQTVKTPLGLFTIAPSPWYAESPYKKSEVEFSHTPIEIAARSIAQIKATPNDSYSNIINIWVTDVSAQRASDISAALIDVYNERRIKNQSLAAKSTADFIDKRLAILNDDLNDVEGDISSFKSANRLPDVSASSMAYFEHSFNNQSQVLSLNSEISMAQYIRRELAGDNIDQVLPTNTGLKADGIQTQISQYNGLVLERNRLLSSGSENNPIISELTATIKTLRTNMVRSLDNYITVLQRQLADINTTDSRANSELAANPGREKYLLSVERQQKVKEQLYVFLLQKREESELSQAYVKPSSYTLHDASVPVTPFYPKKLNILLIAFVVGILAPLLILFLRESLTTTIHGRRDLAQLSIPFIGEIPFGPGRKRRMPIISKMKSASKEDVVVKDGSTNVINEAFRAIRTSLEFMAPNLNKHGKIISITSANSGSGKTFIVMNLATALALSGKKVLCIDLDMRKASLSKWGGRTDRGISNYLIGQAELNDIILHNVDGREGLDLIPVGIIPPNPVELLSSGRIADAYKELREKYDYILVDSTPAEIVADSRIISAGTDMTIWVIRAGMFERAMLQDLEEYAETDRYHNLSIVLNGTDPNNLYRRKRYGYGYGYGYGH